MALASTSLRQINTCALVQALDPFTPPDGQTTSFAMSAGFSGNPVAQISSRSPVNLSAHAGGCRPHPHATGYLERRLSRRETLELKEEKRGISGAFLSFEQGRAPPRTHSKAPKNGNAPKN
jgi:hypothetical protein